MNLYRDSCARCASPALPKTLSPGGFRVNIKIMTDLRNKISETLVRVVSFDYFVVKRNIREFLRDNKPKTVLDLGCGTGILAPFFPKKLYLGIDIDKNLINYAKKRYPGYSFKVMDATMVKLKKKFDFILVVGVIHHLDDNDAKKFVEIIKLHLKKGGKALVIEAIPPLWKWNILGQINRAMDKGAFIRKLDYYKKLFDKKLAVDKSYNQFGGAADYGVLVLSKKDSF